MSHLFGAANTGLPHLRGDTDMIERIRGFLRTACRIDITALEVRSRGAPADAPPERAVPRLSSARALSGRAARTVSHSVAASR